MVSSLRTHGTRLTPCTPSISRKHVEADDAALRLVDDSPSSA